MADQLPAPVSRDQALAELTRDYGMTQPRAERALQVAEHDGWWIAADLVTVRANERDPDTWFYLIGQH